MEKNMRKEVDMQALLDQANEQKIQLQKIVAQRKELEKQVELKERKLEAAKERNRVPESQMEAQAYRILQLMDTHKEEVANLEMLRSESEGLAMLNIEAKDKQKVRLLQHQLVMKDLAQKFQSGPQVYMNQNEIKDNLSHLEKEHHAMQQNVASVLHEVARKQAALRQLYPVNVIKPDTVAVDSNMTSVVKMISKQMKAELKKSKAQERDLQKKLNNLQQLNSLLQTDLSRIEIKMANL